MFRKWIVVLLSGILLTSCAMPAVTASVRPEGQELVLWHSFKDERHDALLLQVDEFNATNPWHIMVVPEFHGDTSQLGTELQTAVEAGTAPDLVVRDPSDVWALGDVVVPVQAYVDDKR